MWIWRAHKRETGRAGVLTAEDENGQSAGIPAVPKRAGIIWRLTTNSKKKYTD